MRFVLAFWDSVADLRQIEFILLVVAMVTPLVCGTIVLTVRQRVKTLLTQSTESTGFSYSENVRKLASQKEHIQADLQRAHQELGTLRRVTAPRQLPAEDEQRLVSSLRGVRAAPVIVSAYNLEDESYAYAKAIASAIRQAGWEVTVNKSSMNDFKGVTLGTINLMQRPLTGLKELDHALK